MFEMKIPMTGLEGYKKVEIPSNFQYEYKFITIVNITDNSVCLYPPNFTTPTAGAALICAGPYSSITIPLGTELLLGFNVIWTNPFGTNVNIPKTVKLIFSEENLNYNSSFAPSFTSGGDVVNTAIVVDEVGLTRRNQLPTSLTGSGNLKVALLEDSVGLVKANQLPGNLSASGNLKTAVQELNFTTVSWNPQTTTDTYADLGTSWAKPGFKSFTLAIFNTGVNGALIQVLGSLDGTAYDIPVQTETPVNAGSNLIISKSDYFPYLKIQVKSQSAGLTTTIQAKGAAVVC